MQYLKQLILIFWFSFVLVAGCAIPSVQHWAETAIGENIQVIKNLEKLPTSYASKIAWKETTHIIQNGNLIYIHPIREGCSVHFEVNSKGKIVGYKAIGDRCY